MSDHIKNFFAAWGAAEGARDAALKSAVLETIRYTDPRGSVEGADALCAYVAQFTANAPGAAAEVAEQTSEGTAYDVRVRFFGEGWEQFGQYNIQLHEDGRLAEITGVAEKSA